MKGGGLTACKVRVKKRIQYPMGVCVGKCWPETRWGGGRMPTEAILEANLGGDTFQKVHNL